MKTDIYQKHFYRAQVKPKGLCRCNITVVESDLDILTERPLDKKFVLQKLCFYRRQIENYITRDRKFLTSLKPVEVELNCAAIVKEMAVQAKKANVGPMAAVAGAIAQFLGKDLIDQGFKEVIIENGGDIFLKIKKTRCIGLYAAKSPFTGKIFLKIKPEMTPLGICTSSGTVGHSLSFGCADSVTILSSNPALADAVATATANLVNKKEDLLSAINFARTIRGVMAVVIVLGNNLASWGKIDMICPQPKAQK
jgi:ApbE superfamily uncharacterized protein (UPF0280 family)